MALFTSHFYNNTGTSVLENTGANIVRKPFQPAFSARGAASNASGSMVVFPTVDFDNGNNYNTTNGRFTAPVAGMYYFYYHQINQRIAGEYRVMFYVNGGWWGGSNYISFAETAAYMSLFVNQHIYLLANDYVNVRYDLGPAALYGGSGYNLFCGYLVG